jgi:pre-mRNA-processing factor 8
VSVAVFDADGGSRHYPRHAEIAPPSEQQLQVADVEDQARDQRQQKVTLKTVNVHGEEIVVTAQTPYENKLFRSRTDWRVRALAASALHLRCAHVFIQSDGVSDGGFTYVLPRNLLRKFVAIGDLRTQVVGFLYGTAPADAHGVKEVRCIVVPPQWGSHQDVHVPLQVPSSEYLAGLEPLGWIHTQPAEDGRASPHDVLMHSQLLARMPNWTPDVTVCMTVSYTPGSVSLAAFRVTAAGVKWAQEAATLPPAQMEQDFALECFELMPLLLTERLLGFYIVPEGGRWNYNFVGVKYDPAKKWALELANPLPFYDPSFRQNHFLTWLETDDRAEELEDVENAFA